MAAIRRELDGEEDAVKHGGRGKFRGAAGCFVLASPEASHIQRGLPDILGKMIHP
ncbi:hypothetical protein [Gemmobacter sp.]|uniref:hypothetical protein n=1 Tax=Gemmobacter sp. TaxID=1898957 RepID=UPI002AFF3575|nr:hypothetical protein [Gemmobacter sp.]